MLPQQYQFAHRYSAVLNEQLRSLVSYGSTNNVYSVPLRFPSDDQAEEFSKLTKSEIPDWLLKHGYNGAFERLLFITLYPALVTDLYQFVDEALSASEQQRLTVAYALLRKPLRDNLFYLEWLLADTSSFLHTFYEKSPADFALEKMLGEDKVRAIIAEAVNRCEMRGTVDPEVIYRMRYQVQEGYYSLHAMWTQALHLITTRVGHATEARNLNLVFSTDRERLMQWRHIYSFVPPVLDHAVSVAETLMCYLLRQRPEEFRVPHFHRALGFNVWSRDTAAWQNDPQLAADFPNDLEDLNVICPRCGKQIDFQDHHARALFLDRQLKCPHCRRRLSIESIVNSNPV